MVFYLINFILLLISPRVENKPDPTCDSFKHKPFDEGNMGQTGIVPWLGVIRAHLHVGMQTKIAVTGAVLIKPKHAIANADDMTKIRIKGSSKAMFISQDRGPWTCKLSDVSVHPEYEFATYNTLALVELDTESLISTAPMLPICMPSYMYNTSNQLYAIGFTDENKLLEKISYKVEHVEKALCDEFYVRAGHEKSLSTPVFYECAFAVNSVKNCDWENGMALVSNASGYWVLVGFSVQGPGCSTPARFIDVYPYLHWIDSASNLEDFDADYPFKIKIRRSDLLTSPENFTGVINTANYSKRDHAPTHETKLSGVHFALDGIDTYSSFKKHHKPLNMSYREFLKKKEYETKPFSAEKKDNVTLDVKDENNFLKINHKPFNMTLREYRKQKENQTKLLGVEKMDNVTLK